MSSILVKKNFVNLRKNKNKILIFIFTIICFVHLFSWFLIKPDDFLNQDIFYTWKEGFRIAEGINPYERILSGSVRLNDKYPVYFPLSFLFSALLCKLGIRDFSSFLTIWRPLNLIAQIVLSYSIYYFYNIKGHWKLGIIAVSISSFGNLGLYILKVQSVEYFAISFLLMSLIFLRKKIIFSSILLGLSLSIKHLGVLFLPFILYEVYKINREKNNIKSFSTLKRFIIISIGIPSLISLPFFFKSPIGFIKSIFFTVTRTDRFGTINFNTTLALDIVKILMVFLIIILFIIYLKDKIPFHLCLSFIMLIFNQFYVNSFIQYKYWGLIFLLVTFAGSLKNNSSISKV